MVKNTGIKCTYEGCGKTYSSKCNLNRHVKLHHENKAFVCPVCQKELSSKQSKDEHLYSHNKTKPYVCPYEGCEHRFRQASQLSFHKKLHKLDLPQVKEEPPLTVQDFSFPAVFMDRFFSFPYFQLPLPAPLQDRVSSQLPK